MTMSHENQPGSEGEYRPSTPDLTPNLESPPVTEEDDLPMFTNGPFNKLGTEDQTDLSKLMQDQELLERQRSIEEEYRALVVLKTKLEQRLSGEIRREHRWDPENEAIAQALIPLLESHAGEIRYLYNRYKTYDEQKQRDLAETGEHVEARIEHTKDKARQRYKEHEEAFKNQATMDYLRAREANPDQYPQPLNYPPYTNDVDQPPSSERQDG